MGKDPTQRPLLRRDRVRRARETVEEPVIQVLERRASDVSQDRRRLEARKVLRERKSDDAYQEWLRQLRDQAYVELRLEER